MTSPQAPVEERSYAPRRRKVSGYTKLDTSKAVTNKQLADASNQVHECLHEAREEIKAIGVQVARIEGALGIGIKPDGTPKRHALSLSRKGLVWLVLGSLAGLQLLYQLVFPSLVAFFQTLHHQLMTGGH